ncbi:hypothetical protein OROMI_023975 [Orobanche minor]
MAADAFHLSPAITLLVVVKGKASSRTSILNRPSSLNALNTSMASFMPIGFYMEGITTSLSFVNHILRQSNYNNALPFKDHRLIIEYQSDDIAGIIFDDVLPEDFKDVVYVISLFGRLMHQHIFGNSGHGDLGNYLCGYFNTTLGSKKEKQTFMENLLTAGVDRPDDMLFVDCWSQKFGEAIKLQ